MIPRTRRILTVSIAVLAVFFLACLLPLPLPVHKDLSGLSWEDRNPEVQTATQVSIDGLYFVYLVPFFHENAFHGDIRIADRVYSMESSSSLIDFSRFPRHDGLLMYRGTDGEFHFGGMAAERGFFSEFAFTPFVDGGSTDLWVSAPARTRQEALDLARRLVPKILTLE